MPVYKVKGGYKWGKAGKTYPTKKKTSRKTSKIMVYQSKGRKLG